VQSPETEEEKYISQLEEEHKHAEVDHGLSVAG
jgi:hypothetical protein